MYKWLAGPTVSLLDICASPSSFCVPEQMSLRTLAAELSGSLGHRSTSQGLGLVLLVLRMPACAFAIRLFLPCESLYCVPAVPKLL